MEQIATVKYGCGIYVPELKYVKPEYQKIPWVSTLQSMIPNTEILYAPNDANLNYGNVESLHQTRLWSIDQNCEGSKIKGLYTGCILPFSRQPKLFGGLGHSYQNVLTALRNKYSKYLIDDFDYEAHFVQYEIVEI